MMELYVHIPFCMKKCNYCDFLSGVYDESVQVRYAIKLQEEIRYFGKLFPKETISTIYFGGGTPTWISPELLCNIMEEIKKNFKIDEDSEITIECNPGTASKDSLLRYREAGFDRISIGLQSPYDDELKELGRVHDVKRFQTTFQAARSVGFANISVDIMTGLPFQTAERLAQTVEYLAALKPEHISAYSLSIEEGTPFYKKYQFDLIKQEAGVKPTYLPTEEQLLQMTDMLEQMLCERGYRQYEISNFAREGCECRHNVGYWTRVPYLGVGIGAASLLPVKGMRVKDDRMRFLEIRTTNGRDMEQYLNTEFEKMPELSLETGEGEVCTLPIGSPFWEKVDSISKKEAMQEFMFLGLRMTDGVSRRDFERSFMPLTIESVYGDVIRENERRGLLYQANGRIALTKQGQRIANYVMMQFL